MTRDLIDAVSPEGVIITLKGQRRPIWAGNLNLADRDLKSLNGAPVEVTGSFYCHSNQLKSLEGCPEKVGGGFYCNDNQLTSLEGCPASVGRDFYCFSNQLTSLSGIHNLIKKMDGTFWCDDVTHVLGLCLIQGIMDVWHHKPAVRDILNRHLNQGRGGMVDCYDELMEAELEEYAHL